MIGAYMKCGVALDSRNGFDGIRRFLEIQLRQNRAELVTNNVDRFCNFRGLSTVRIRIPEMHNLENIAHSMCNSSLLVLFNDMISLNKLTVN